MTDRKISLLCLLPLFFVPRFAVAQGLEVAELPKDRTVTYSRDILPLLSKSCVPCHNSSTAESGVNLESVGKMASSDVDGVLVPGKPDVSLLFLLAAHSTQPVMPPEDNDVSASVMSPMDLAMLRRWIEAGAEVDKPTPSVSKRMWQPLPESLQTAYAASLTPDGRLLAASFGAQIGIFSARSTKPLATLSTISAGVFGPAHDDFVQDLYLDPSGTRLISAGFRNVRFWEFQPFQVAQIPATQRSDVLAMSLNLTGSHLAVLSRDGEIRVTAIGESHWQWTQKFNLPETVLSEEHPQVLLAVDDMGDSVVIGWANSLRLVSRDTNDEDFVTSHEVTKIVSRDAQSFVIADKSGGVTFFNRREKTWQADQQKALDRSVSMLLNPVADRASMVAIDEAGQIARWDASNLKFSSGGTLPSPPVSGGITQSRDVIWLALKSGAIGKYLIAEDKFVESAKADPLTRQHATETHWDTLVAEKIVETNQNNVKAADDAVVAEEKNLETIRKEIKSLVKSRDEKARKAEDAKSAATDSAQRLVVANESGEGVKAASEAASKADKGVAEKDKELAEASAELKTAQKTVSLGASRLQALQAEAKRQNELLGQSKAALEELKERELDAKTAFDRSPATNGILTVVGKNDDLLSQSKASGVWSLWSKSGDWVAELSDLKPDNELLAVSQDCFVVARRDGRVRAFTSSPRPWRQSKMVGSVDGDSPFADRVLCLDVDPTGSLLATGGGDPSRSGELMLWNTLDGSFIRSFDSSHSDTVVSVSFSPDGKTLASGSADRMIKLWDVESGALLKTLEGHTHHVNAIAWNVHRQQLATGSADATVKIWDVDSGKATQTINGLKSEITNLVFIGRDDRIGVISGDGSFRIYRTDKGTRETNVKLTDGYLYAFDVNRDGTKFVVGSAEGDVTLIGKSGNQLQKFRLSDD